MVIIQDKSKRKPTGARYKDVMTKRLNRMGREPTLTKLGEKKVKSTRTKGGNEKRRLQAANLLNIYDPKTKKYARVKIKSVGENPANRHFQRRNIITKGSVLETEKGKVRVTSRPGQDGVLNATLIQ